MSRRCIVHYPDLDNYSALKDVSTVNERRIKEAKALRETLKGRNHHEEQCNLIPATIDPSKHAVHLDPCYKRFTLIISQ